MEDTRSHWQNVWTAKADYQVSWFEIEPST